LAKTVVLIDDDQDDLEILKETISSIDPSLHCISFIYPAEAIRVISSELVVIPDYVFTDINMPGMTGDECVKELRSMKEFDNTVITVLSTTMQNDVADQLRKIGANYTFQKPAKISAYNDILSRIFLANANGRDSMMGKRGKSVL
jgi:CheY-like chemotaxis protein